MYVSVWPARTQATPAFARQNSGEGLEPLELELQMLVICDVGLGPLEEQPVLKTTE